MPIAPEQFGLSLSAALTAALTRQGRTHGLTLNTFMQVAWAILLGRLTGRDDVVLGVTVAGRPPEIAGIESMVGLFINTLPLRIRLPANKPLLVLLREVQDNQSRLMMHQHLGLAEIQALAGLGELFDTLVVFENYPVDSNGYSADAGGLRLSSVAGHDATHYPLSLMAVPGDRLRLRLGLSRRPVRSAAHRGSGGEARSAAGSGGGGARAGDWAARHSCPAERDTLLRVWNDTAHAVPVRHPGGAVRGAGGRSPDAIAVVFEDESLSYGELDARANQLAHHLRELGVGAEIVVGLCVERSLEMLIGLLGILKAGGAYLPLDPTYPQERLAFMLADAGAPVLVTQSALLDRLGAPAARIVRLDADAPAIARRSIIAPVLWLDPQNTAYVIYTSGSTGRQKGCAVPLHGWIALAGQRRIR